MARGDVAVAARCLEEAIRPGMPRARTDERVGWYLLAEGLHNLRTLGDLARGLTKR